MLRSRIIPATMAAVIALGAAGAAFAASGENENHQEISAVLGANTSVAQAIATAEQHTGGRAMKISIQEEKGAYVYDVKTVSNDKIVEVFIEPTTGQVVRAEDEGLIAKVFDGEDQKEFAKLAASSTTLSAAIAAAEQNTGGKAIEAGFDNQNGAMVFEVEVAKDNAMHKVMIDGASGKVLSVAAAADGDNEED